MPIHSVLPVLPELPVLPAVIEAAGMPTATRVVVVLVLVVVATAALGTATLARSGRLRRRGRLGVRTPSALASDDAFAVANGTAAPFLVLAGVFAALAAVLVGVTGLRGSGGVPALIGCGVVVGGLLVLGAGRAERAAKLVLARGEQRGPAATSNRPGGPGRPAVRPRASGRKRRR